MNYELFKLILHEIRQFCDFSEQLYNVTAFKNC